jgi:hypothetical protein
VPTPVVDLGDPYLNLLHAFWNAVKEDVRGDAPVFGHVASKYRGLPAEERAKIEKDRARGLALAFLESEHFDGWVTITADLTDTDITAEQMREAIYAGY